MQPEKFPGKVGSTFDGKALALTPCRITGSEVRDRDDSLPLALTIAFLSCSRTDQENVPLLVANTLIRVTHNIPNVWQSADHLCVVWCLQFVLVVNRFLHSIIDLDKKSNSKFIANKEIRLTKAYQFFMPQPPWLALDPSFIYGSSAPVRWSASGSPPISPLYKVQPPKKPQPPWLSLDAPLIYGSAAPVGWFASGSPLIRPPYKIHPPKKPQPPWLALDPPFIYGSSAPVRWSASGSPPISPLYKVHPPKKPQPPWLTLDPPFIYGSSAPVRWSASGSSPISPLYKVQPPKKPQPPWLALDAPLIYGSAAPVGWFASGSPLIRPLYKVHPPKMPQPPWLALDSPFIHISSVQAEYPFRFLQDSDSVFSS
ncbi:mitochondrial processing peptidase beta subunit [Culex quinquefasciatus]|uniref:Mitochondrial processing peptidase beta subunit n=1 Tax=Culex quinquefasciatus TaxID=7176 RepID=B0X9H8_CULQU|nr:mitochondrial processing peptidase beta subunit [Culex quinquefasciatus]|eukprot:XP_001866300.1 mitochondrial processing peptidase beta subunit [Culex quinquefasciatus]